MSHSHYSKALDTRLATVEGSIAAIRRMMADGRPCEELLLQLKAAESSINKISKLILKDHFEHCVKEGIENGDEHAIESFSNILDKYMK
ncbi:MAG: metal-sensing transcriptional repressor [Clostridia bacterium]|nr:metal-sensing transcriptional repressor [Clostridia bacterium]